jgi:hypothetical protein
MSIKTTLRPYIWRHDLLGEDYGRTKRQQRRYFGKAIGPIQFRKIKHYRTYNGLMGVHEKHISGKEYYQLYY